MLLRSQLNKRGKQMPGQCGRATSKKYHSKKQQGKKRASQNSEKLDKVPVLNNLETERKNQRCTSENIKNDGLSTFKDDFEVVTSHISGTDQIEQIEIVSDSASTLAESNETQKTSEKKVYKSLRKKKNSTKRRFTMTQLRIEKIKASVTILGRETESVVIKKQIASFLNHNGNNILYLTGVPGSGKTHTALSIIKHFGVPFSYINCPTLRSKKDIYAEICASLPCFNSKTMGIPHLRYHLRACECHHIVVIDEIDFLTTKNEKFLYNLFELPLVENSRIFMIVISNTLGSLSPKVESRISKNRIEFRPYNSEQLMSISQATIRNSEKSVDSKSLELITKRIASSTGDVRKVIDIIETQNLSLSAASAILKDIFTPLLNRFFASFTFYQKLAFYLNTDTSTSIFQWFDNFKSFCRMKEYPNLNFTDFQLVVNELVSFDVYKIKRDGITVVCNYLQEEMQMAMMNDEQVVVFRNNNK